MEININDHSKIVEIWLKSDEKDDRQLRTSLEPMYSVYKDEKYTVAVFESGEKDLSANTLALIMGNRNYFS